MQIYSADTFGQRSSFKTSINVRASEESMLANIWTVFEYNIAINLLIV